MMTSSKPEECFVYIVLPGETEFVTAGRFDHSGGDAPVGRFVYGKSYLARNNAVPIDPTELKLGSTIYRTALLKGIFGALRDAGPDYWGRRVIQKHAVSDGARNLPRRDENSTARSISRSCRRMPMQSSMMRNCRKSPTRSRPRN
jgi:hypothetical protein